MPIFAEKESHSEPTVVLNAKQEEEFQRWGYKCRLPIIITGEPAKRKMNKLTINGFDAFVGDISLMILLRLVIQLNKTGVGTVSKASLVSAGYVTFTGKEQAIERLRKALGRVLRPYTGHDLIESYGSGAIRLSIHPSLVKYDKRKLSQHYNEKIKRLARRLP